MGIQYRLLTYSLVTVLVISGVGLGVYFGIFHDKNAGVYDQVILTLEGDTTTRNYTLSELMSYPNITGSAGYKKSTGTIVGPNLYKGVELSVLFEDIGGIKPGEDFKVIADDGYYVFLTSEMLNGRLPSYDSETGEYLGNGEFHIILAYEIDDVIQASGPGALRLVVVPIEGENYLTDGSIWVKQVVNIELITDPLWIVYLYGITNDSIDRPTYEAFMNINDSELLEVYQLQEGIRTYTYEGIALWRIIALFDGESVSGDWDFNDSLAISGYKVILKSFFLDTLVLRSEDIARNDSYILAARRNSNYLKGAEGPLMLVGPSVSFSQMITGIREIHIVLD